MCAPRRRSVFLSARTLTRPSVSLLHLARLLASRGKMPTLYSTPCGRNTQCSVSTRTIYFFIYWRLIAQSTATGWPQGFFTKLNLTQVEYNSKHAHVTNVKHVNIIIWKWVPSILLSLKKWQIKLGDTDPIDRFGLAFQYLIKKIIKKNGQKQLQIKNTM